MPIDTTIYSALWFGDIGIGKIEKSELNGIGRTVISTGESLARGVAPSPSGDVVYWAQSSNLRRSDWFGGNKTTVASGFVITDVAIDPLNQKIYFASVDKIRVYTVSTNKVTTFMDLSSEGSRTIEFLDIDVTGGRIYFTEANQNLIRSIKLDGDGAETFMTIGSSYGIGGICLDLVNSKMYFVARHVTNSSRRGIFRTNNLSANQNISSFTPIISYQNTQGDIAVNPYESQMYFTDFTSNRIKTVSTSGASSDVVDFISTGISTPVYLNCPPVPINLYQSVLASGIRSMANSLPLSIKIAKKLNATPGLIYGMDEQFMENYDLNEFKCNLRYVGSEGDVSIEVFSCSSSGIEQISLPNVSCYPLDDNGLWGYSTSNFDILARRDITYYFVMTSKDGQVGTGAIQVRNPRVAIDTDGPTKLIIE